MFDRLIRSLAATVVATTCLAQTSVVTAQQTPMNTQFQSPVTVIPTATVPSVTTVSGTAEIKFAKYLATNNIKFYGAYWCSHCQEQKSLFGAVAASKLLYIECAGDGKNSQRQLCKDINIQYFPTWEMKGKFLPGTYDLKELAILTRYNGSLKFKYHKQ